MEAVSDNSIYVPLSCPLLILCLLLTKSLHDTSHPVLKTKAIVFHRSTITKHKSYVIPKAPPYILA